MKQVFITNKARFLYILDVKYITGYHIRKEEDVWIYPSMISTLSGANLLRVEEYLVNCKNMIAPFAESSEIFHKCLHTEGINRNNKSLMCWRQRLIKLNEAEISYMKSDQVQDTVVIAYS